MDAQEYFIIVLNAQRYAIIQALESSDINELRNALDYLWAANQRMAEVLGIDKSLVTVVDIYREVKEIAALEALAELDQDANLPGNTSSE